MSHPDDYREMGGCDGCGAAAVPVLVCHLTMPTGTMQVIAPCDGCMA